MMQGKAAVAAASGHILYMFEHSFCFVCVEIFCIFLRVDAHSFTHSLHIQHEKETMQEERKRALDKKDEVMQLSAYNDIMCMNIERIYCNSINESISTMSKNNKKSGFI